MEKGLKELRGFAAPWREQQCKPARPPGAPRDWTTNQRVHMEGPMAPAAYVAKDGLWDISGRRALGTVKVRCPSVGEWKCREVGVGGWKGEYPHRTW